MVWSKSEPTAKNAGYDKKFVVAPLLQEVGLMLQARDNKTSEERLCLRVGGYWYHFGGPLTLRLLNNV